MSTCASPASTSTDVSIGEVLVVEDDPIVSSLVSHVLTRRGFGVHVVANGREAHALLTDRARFKVVVLDVMLPFVDGFELLDAIRRSPTWQDVPIVMLTSKSQERYVVRAFDAGVNDYIVKPFRPAEFVARVHRLARGHARELDHGNSKQFGQVLSPREARPEDAATSEAERAGSDSRRSVAEPR